MSNNIAAPEKRSEAALEDGPAMRLVHTDAPWSSKQMRSGVAHEPTTHGQPYVPGEHTAASRTQNRLSLHTKSDAAQPTPSLHGHAT